MQKKGGLGPTELAVGNIRQVSVAEGNAQNVLGKNHLHLTN